MKENEFEEINSLIKTKKGILSRIKDLIKDSFEKNEFKNIDKEALRKFVEANTKPPKVDKELLEELGYEDEFDIIEENEIPFDNSSNDKVDEDIKVDFGKERNIESKNKDEFFELYNKVKRGEISVENVSAIDLLKINELLKEEIDVTKKKFNIDELEKIDEEIKNLEEENIKLNKELEKLENKNNQ